MIILAVILIQSLYDFVFWYGIFKDYDNGSFSRKVYRVIKFIVDYPVTIFFLYHVTDLKYIIAFYTFKQCGGCDGIYILLWKVFNSKEDYTKDGIYWLWWIPCAWFKNEIIYNPTINADEINLYHCIIGKWYLKKAVITLDDFIECVSIGTLLAICIIIIF